MAVGLQTGTNAMSERKYSNDHEWILVQGDVGTVGISDHAQEQLGDVVYVELPDTGKQFEKGAEAATIESVKAASEINAPVSGEIVESNAALAEEPALVNSDPLGKGWFFRIKINDLSELDGMMDENAYLNYVETLD